MTPIRPGLSPAASPTAAVRPAAEGRLAAQKAFFEIATGQASAAAAPAPARAAAPQAAVAAAPRASSAAAKSPVRTLRPGSLLDIRV